MWITGINIRMDVTATRLSHDDGRAWTCVCVSLPKDDRCQSFNFVISVGMCEFSDRTKEARPEDFIPDPDRYYYQRAMDRGIKTKSRDITTLI